MVPLYWPAYVLIKTVNPFLFPLSIYGRENIPRQGAFLLACNHISNLDPPLVSYAVRRPIHHIAKKSLFKNPLFAGLLYGLGAFPIKREGSDIGAMKECLRKLGSGTPLAMFPTGTRVAEGRSLSAKGGIGFLAVKTGLPIIPLKIQGTDKALPKGAKKLTKHPVSITIGRPLTLCEKDSYGAIGEKVLNAIEAL